MRIVSVMKASRLQRIAPEGMMQGHFAETTPLFRTVVKPRGGGGLGGGRGGERFSFTSLCVCHRAHCTQASHDGSSDYRILVIARVVYRLHSLHSPQTAVVNTAAPASTCRHETSSDKTSRMQDGHTDVVDMLLCPRSERRGGRRAALGVVPRGSRHPRTHAPPGFHLRAPALRPACCRPRAASVGPLPAPAAPPQPSRGLRASPPFMT